MLFGLFFNLILILLCNIREFFFANRVNTIISTYYKIKACNNASKDRQHLGQTKMLFAEMYIVE